MNNAEKISPVSLCDTGSCAQCPERTGQEVAGPHDRPTRHPDQEIIRSGSATFSFHTAAVSEPTSLYFLSALDARSFRNNLGCAKLRRGSAGRRLLNEGRHGHEHPARSIRARHAGFGALETSRTIFSSNYAQQAGLGRRTFAYLHPSESCYLDHKLFRLAIAGATRHDGCSMPCHLCICHGANKEARRSGLVQQTCNNKDE